MIISWFCLWDAPEGQSVVLDAYDRGALTALVKDCPGLEAAYIMTPTEGNDPYFPDSHNPSALLLQMDFHDLASLELALSEKGHLEPLADVDLWPSLSGCSQSHQAMAARHYAVAEPALPPSNRSCLAYMVEYEGPAEDENAWHLAYVARHPLLLAKFPGIRAIEIYTPITVICGLPLKLRRAMQRNKTVFDSTSAMNAAMETPARKELRADALKLPPFVGAKDHFPFQSQMIGGSAKP